MLKIGCVQFSAIEGDIEKNCARLRRLTEVYSKDDIDLLCFPELCISGYEFDSARKSKEEEKFFGSLAKEYHIAIMAGISICENEKFYDAACLWDETGKLLGEFRKIPLWDKECDFFEKGDELSVIPFKGWNIGLLICQDMRFFEASTPLVNMGADVILYPSAWVKDWKELFLLCARMRAAENQVYVLALNRASGDVQYCGATSVIDPYGNIVQGAAGDGETYIRAVLEKDKIRETRETLQWESLKLPDIYKKYEQYRFRDV